MKKRFHDILPYSNLPYANLPYTILSYIPIYPIPIYPIPFYPIIKAIETYPILLKNPKQYIPEQIKEPLIMIKEYLTHVNKISKQRKTCASEKEMSSKHERTEILIQCCYRNALRLLLKQTKVISHQVDIA